jgi:two-component system KDP operon response regulator KdpE
MSVEPLVLAADDEAGILRMIKLELSSQGLRVITASSGEEALRLLDEHRPDIVLLDIVMPEMNGLETMRLVKDRRNVPVILLTARDREADKIRGLEMGADDYLAKPFSPDELTARVRAVLRRSIGSQSTGNVVKAGDIEIDLTRRVVTRDGEPVNLTRTEWMLLQHLAANPGKVMLNAELLTKVWGPEYRSDLQYLRVWVSRLRQKIEKNPSQPMMLKTFTGIGYMFDPGDDAPASNGADLAASNGHAAEPPPARANGTGKMSRVVA